MDYRNKLGMFSFEDGAQESSMKLIVQNVTGQYLNPKKGEPDLTDEQSCYDFILGCGNVLGAVGFDLVINEDVRVYTKTQLVTKKIKDFDAKVQKMAGQITNVGDVAALAGEAFEAVQELLAPGPMPRPSFGGWLVGPASLVQ